MRLDRFPLFQRQTQTLGLGHVEDGVGVGSRVKEKGIRWQRAPCPCWYLCWHTWEGKGRGKQGQLCTSVLTDEGGEAAVVSPLQCVSTMWRPLRSI